MGVPGSTSTPCGQWTGAPGNTKRCVAHWLVLSAVQALCGLAVQSRHMANRLARLAVKNVKWLGDGRSGQYKHAMWPIDWCCRHHETHLKAHGSLTGAPGSTDTRCGPLPGPSSRHGSSAFRSLEVRIRLYSCHPRAGWPGNPRTCKHAYGRIWVRVGRSC